MSGLAEHNVVIVGAGISGLMCAYELMKQMLNCRIIVLEATSSVGGRIASQSMDTLPAGHVLDTGAEFIHGSKTVLTDLIEDLGQDNDWIMNDEFLEPIFITSHADGGPDDGPTTQGKYGMYCIDGELKMYNDSRLTLLNEALETILENQVYDPSVSVAEALRQAGTLPPELLSLAQASYGNTAACTDLAQLSLSMIQRFERHWKENEVEGDFRPQSTVGMMGIVNKLLAKLQQNKEFQLQLNSQVVRIQRSDHGVRLELANGSCIQADAAVVTVPPPILAELDMELSNEKKDALKYIGFERVVKVCVAFSKQLWPFQVQSIVCANEVFPEVWFREFVDKSKGNNTCFMAVGYLTSKAADKYVDTLTKHPSNESSNDLAGSLLLEQLSKMFSIPIEFLKSAHTDTVWYDWKGHPFIQGGYIYPRVGCKPEHFEALARPMHRIYFAGEATNTNACCTIQAAMETGQRAANEIADLLRG